MTFSGSNGQSLLLRIALGNDQLYRNPDYSWDEYIQS